ncbi:Methyltransferase OMS1, mitochondrial [Madurella mycetomatis]|uniref:Methyltransferase OMS1, mitochondrial n=1 Tax=Madurella mycetomatis TaxID=100816 RepID=A0A175VSP2_9PEZI|nr:Methyltransferase OMS1, mitochondrial [Madurella mycetomatis]
MASQLRIPLRLPLSCPHSNWHSAKSFTSSARLGASKTRRAPVKPVTLKQPQQPPKATKTTPSPSSSTNSNSKAESIDVLFQQRKWPLVGAGCAALVIGLYTSLLISASLKEGDNQSPSSASVSAQPTPPPSSSPSASCSCTCPPASLQQPTGLPAALDTSTPEAAHLSATSFDKGLDLEESVMGIRSLRRGLAARARGHVLEVAVGTGRNLGYYDWSEVVAQSRGADEETRARRERERVVRGDGGGDGGEGKGVREVGAYEGEVLSFTGVDVSGDMMGVARDRVREAVPGLRRIMRRRRLEAMPRLGEDGAEEAVVVDALDGRVRLVLADALKRLPSPPAGLSPASSRGNPEKFDTIVQTFGLCSVADPGKLLANMAAKVQPDTGRIILLEHGRGWYDFVNKRLDNNALGHFQKYGCWWNRDIEQLVRDATHAVPGLEVVKLERPLLFQWGTTLLIELKVKSQQAGGKGSVKSGVTA